MATHIYNFRELCIHCSVCHTDNDTSVVSANLYFTRRITRLCIRSSRFQTENHKNNAMLTCLIYVTWRITRTKGTNLTCRTKNIDMTSTFMRKVMRIMHEGNGNIGSLIVDKILAYLKETHGESNYFASTALDFTQQNTKTKQC